MPKVKIAPLTIKWLRCEIGDDWDHNAFNIELRALVTIARVAIRQRQTHDTPGLPRDSCECPFCRATRRLERIPKGAK